MAVFFFTGMLSHFAGITSTLAYELLYSNYDDQISLIRDAVGSGGTIKAQANTPDLLKCDAMVYLWVSWDMRSVAMGK